MDYHIFNTWQKIRKMLFLRPNSTTSRRNLLNFDFLLIGTFVGEDYLDMFIISQMDF
jgi:hypothetical protein